MHPTKFLTFALLLLYSCNSFTQQPPAPVQTTTHGFRFVKHTDKGGRKPVYGDAVVSTVDVWVGKHQLESSRNKRGGIYTYDIPDSLATIKYLPPVMEASLLMGIGDSATIYQPIDSFMQSFVPKSEQKEKEIRFEIVIRRILTSEEDSKAKQQSTVMLERILEAQRKVAGAYRDGKLGEKPLTTASGLQVYIGDKGAGAPVQRGETVQTHYVGCLLNGEMFDNTISKREPMSFPVGMGQMIAGFDEGVQLLNHGGKAYFIIPPKLGYGDKARPKIPANSELIFYVEVL
jgi:FKBP-type peptidyl-prolyl cis-trans isomerase FkpA